MIESIDHPPLTSSNRLSVHVKQAIAAAIALGEPQASVAKRFNTTRQTVHAICKPLRDLPQSPLNTSEWRRELTDTIPAMSVASIKASVQDRDDVHKAASTAIAHLKGIGVLAGEGNSTVNVFVGQVLNLPADWQSEYLSVEATPVVNVTASELPASTDPHE